MYINTKTDKKLELSKVTIKNYLSVKHTEIDFTKDNIITIIGDNGTGKTNILKILDVCCTMIKNEQNNHDAYNRFINDKLMWANKDFLLNNPDGNMAVTMFFNYTDLPHKNIVTYELSLDENSVSIINRKTQDQCLTEAQIKILSFDATNHQYINVEMSSVSMLDGAGISLIPRSSAPSDPEDLLTSPNLEKYSIRKIKESKDHDERMTHIHNYTSVNMSITEYDERSVGDEDIESIYWDILAAAIVSYAPTKNIKIEENYPIVSNAPTKNIKIEENYPHKQIINGFFNEFNKYTDLKESTNSSSTRVTISIGQVESQVKYIQSMLQKIKDMNYTSSITNVTVCGPEPDQYIYSVELILKDILAHDDSNNRVHNMDNSKLCNILYQTMKLQEYVNDVYLKKILSDAKPYKLMEKLDISTGNNEIYLLLELAVLTREELPIQPLGLDIYFYFDPRRHTGKKHASEPSGFLSILALYLKMGMAAEQRTALLLIDEPARNMSPHTQESIVTFLKEFSDKHNMKILYTTHSPHLIHKMPHVYIAYKEAEYGTKLIEMNSIIKVIGSDEKKRKSALSADFQSNYRIKVEPEKLNDYLVKILLPSYFFIQSYISYNNLRTKDWSAPEDRKDFIIKACAIMLKDSCNQVHIDNIIILAKNCFKNTEFTASSWVKILDNVYTTLTLKIKPPELLHDGGEPKGHLPDKLKKDFEMQNYLGNKKMSTQHQRQAKNIPPEIKSRLQESLIEHS